MKKVKSILSLLLAILMVAGCMATASAAADGEVEDNGSIATATKFTVGTKIDGSLESADDVDYYKFTATSAGLAYVKIDHAVITGSDSSATYFNIVVTNEEEVVVADFSSTGNSASDESNSFTVSKDEVYYVKVTMGRVYNGAVSYSITAAVEKNVNTESEPNNTAQEADVLAYSEKDVPKNYYGSLSENDVDYFVITTPSTGVVNLYLYNDSVKKSKFNATLMTWVEGKEGTQELEEVTSITIEATESTKIGPSVGVPAGKHIIKIDGEVGSYRTRVLFRNNASVETENNDSLLLADDLTFKTACKATIDEKTDVDVFEFNAPADNAGYEILFTATNSAQWEIRLLNSDGEAVKDALHVTTTDSNKNAKIDTDKLKEGAYYVRVSAGETHDSELYSITVTPKAASENKEPEEEKNLFDRIKDLDWGGLWDNFSGWIEEINFFGMLSSLSASIIRIITYFTSVIG